jgi:hypothetical protein
VVTADTIQETEHGKLKVLEKLANLMRCVIRVTLLAGMNDCTEGFTEHCQVSGTCGVLVCTIYCTRLLVYTGGINTGCH